MAFPSGAHWTYVAPFVVCFRQHINCMAHKAFKVVDFVSIPPLPGRVPKLTVTALVLSL